MCGPFTNYNGGMIIINASSLEEAQQIATNDPFVRGGDVRTAEVRSLELSCEGNNHMGIGVNPLTMVYDNLPILPKPCLLARRRGRAWHRSKDIFWVGATGGPPAAQNKEWRNSVVVGTQFGGGAIKSDLGVVDVTGEGGGCRDFCRDTLSKSVAKEEMEAEAFVNGIAGKCFLLSTFAQCFTSLLSSCSRLLTEGL